MDNLITDLLAKRNYTQARKAIDKKLKQKKFEDNSSLLLAKATAQHGFGEVTASLELCTQLCQKKPLSQDVDEVKDLYNLLLKLRQDVVVDDALCEKLWRNAVACQPKGQRQQDWSEEWASEAIRHRHWTMLTKAAMLLKQSSPQTSHEWRKYSFWLITAQWLASRDSSVSSSSGQTDQRMAMLNATLATRQLDDAVKAAETNDQSGTSTTSRLRIDNRKELKLLAYVFAEQSNHGRLAEILDSTVIKSIVGDDDDFAIYLREAKVHSRDATEVQKWLKDFVNELKAGQNGCSRLDDWQIWKSLLDSAAKLQTTDVSSSEEAMDELLPLVEGAIEPNKVSRAARLAKLEIQCDGSRKGTTDDDSVTAIIQHFKHNAAQGFIVDDIQRHLHQLDSSSYARVRKEIAQDAKPEDLKTMESSEQLKWLTSEINTLKLDLAYLQARSTAHQGSQANGRQRNGARDLYTADAGLLKSVAVNSLRLYRISRSHTAKIHEKAMHPGDDACLVAVEALLLLSRATKKNSMMLQALCLLDSVLGDNKHNFLARTQITGLLQHFGLYTLAWQAYQALDVKEILHETMSPLLFLRIGSLQAPSSKGFNAFDFTTKALEFYSKSLDKIPDFQSLALDYENYTQVVHMHQFREQLQLSPTRLMLLFERRRQARLVHNQMPKKASAEEADLAEVLRKTYTGAAEVPKRAQPDRHPGPPLSKTYNEWLMLVDLACELARSDQWEPASFASQQRTFLQVKKMLEARTPAGDLTEAELNVLKAAEAILSVLVHVSGSSKTVESPDITAALSVLNDLVSTLIQQFTRNTTALDILPRWEVYHETYLAMELCQTLDIVMAKMQKAKTITTDKKDIDSKAKSILATTKELFEAVQKVWRDYSRELSSYSGDQILKLVMGGNEGSTDDAIAQAVYEVMGTQNARRFLQTYVTAARTSIDAVLGIKLSK